MEKTTYEVIQRNPALTRELHAFDKVLRNDLPLRLDEALCDAPLLEEVGESDDLDLHPCHLHEALHVHTPGTRARAKERSTVHFRETVATLELRQADRSVLLEEIDHRFDVLWRKSQAAGMRVFERRQHAQVQARQGLVELAALLSSEQQQIYYVCYRKRAFDTASEAEREAQRLSARKVNEPLSAYHCVYGEHYHIGHGKPVAPVATFPAFEQRFARIWLRHPAIARAYLQDLHLI